MSPDLPKPRHLQPMEILDAQGDLLERLTSNPDFRQYHALTATKSVVAADGQEDPDIGWAWISALQNFVHAAYAYRVTEDMGALLEHAAMSLDESDTFDHQLAPTGTGIVYFERPIRVMDVQGKTMLVHWVVWGPADVRGPGMAFAFFNDRYIHADDVWSDFHRNIERAEGVNISEQESARVWEQAGHIIGRWASVSQGAFRSGDSLGPTTVEAQIVQQAALIAKGVEPQLATNLYRYMHALFLLLNQTVVETQDEEAERAGRRRAVRRGLPRTSVTVIQLRRTQGARSQGESLVEWSHRWVVRGHWRWQACGVGRQERRRIWIHPFYKGPEDKPLIITDKLYSLER